MNGVQTRFKCKLDVKRCKRFVFPPSSLLPRSNALKTKAIRYFQTDRTLTRIVSPPLLGQSQSARYIRYKNIDVPTPNLAISELRVFGLGMGKTPQQPKKLTLDRHADRRDITISWEPVKGAQGYNVLWGIAPDKLYSSWMVYGNNELLMKSLTIDQDYYFCVEAFNENGVSLRSEVKHVK